MQLIAAAAMVAGMLLVWWAGEETFRGVDLLARSLEEFKERSPHALVQPLVVLWLIGPAIVMSGLRGVTGALVTPVSYRRLALVLWLVAMLALGHYYINYEEDIPDRSPLHDGTVQQGFWLTGSSTTLLGLLILTEWVIRPPARDPFAAPQESGPVEDADRLWRGEYVTCPYCGMLNEPGARSCYNCDTPHA